MIEKKIKQFKMMSSRISEINLLLDILPLSDEMDCSYYADLLSRSRQFMLEGNIPREILELTLNKGFRRCGYYYYRFHCNGCRQCQNYRILSQKFRPSRSQQRVLQRNRDLEFRVVEPNASSTKEEIYLRYQFQQHHLRTPAYIRHPRPFNPEVELETMYYQMYTNPDCTRELEIYLDDQLLGFGNVDVAIASMSAIYFVFDPRFHKRSLGTYAILKGVEWAGNEGFSYYHLGYYIAHHPKMGYKIKFGNAQVYHPDVDNQWRDVEAPADYLVATQVS